MAIRKYDNVLSFDLPKGYEVVKGTNDEGAATYAVNVGKTTDENGATVYKYLSNIFDGEKEGNAMKEADDASAIKLHGTYQNLFRIHESKTEFLGMALTVTLAVGFVIYKEKAYCVKSTLVGGMDDDQFEGWVDFLNSILGAMRFEGQPGNFEKITPQMIRTISVNIEDKADHPYPIASPKPGQHTHLDFLSRTAGALGMLGGLIQMNQTGTEYSFEQIDEDFLEQFDNSRQLMSIAKADKDSFALSDTARKMGEIFRVNEEAFDAHEDREQEIEAGLVRRCEMYEEFRSFAWTLAAHCGKEGITAEAVDMSTLEEIVEFVVEERNKLNYTADSFCSTLCSGDDIHNYYIPDATPVQAKKALIKTMSVDAAEDNDYDPQAHILSLDGLRKDLEYLYPAMQTIYDSLAETRDFDEHLEGAIAEVLYVWCAMTYAARTPIYTEDGPVNCGWLHPGKKATILPPKKKIVAAKKEDECEFSFTFDQGLKYANKTYSFNIPDGFIIQTDDADRDFVAFLPDKEDPENQLLSKFIIYAGTQKSNELASQLHIPEALTADLVAGSIVPIDIFAKTKRLFYERKDLPGVITYCYDTINRCIHAYAIVSIGTDSKMMRFQITVSNAKQYAACEKLIYQFLDGMSAKKPAKMLQDLDDDEFVTMDPSSVTATKWGKLVGEYAQQLQVARALYQRVLVSAFEAKQQIGSANVSELKKDLREMLRYLTQNAEKYLKKADAVFQLIRSRVPGQVLSTIKKNLSALSDELSQYVELDGQKIAATAAYQEAYKKHAKTTPEQAIADILATDTNKLSSSTIHALRSVSGNAVPAPKADSSPKQPAKDASFQKEKSEDKALADSISAMEKKRQQIINGSKFVRSTLSDIQAERREAERAFNDAKRRIERMTAGSINIFSYGLEDTIREIIHTAADAGEKLSETCVSLVKKLDKKCRPYIDDGMDSQLMKAIADELQELNETAVVNFDFTGSFEGTSFGHVGNIHYEPTREAKSIESYWRSEARTARSGNWEAELLKEFGISKQEYQRHGKYKSAVEIFKKATTSAKIQQAQKSFEALKGYLDAESYIHECEKKLPALIAKEEKEAQERAALEAKRKAEEEERARQAEIQRRDSTYKAALAFMQQNTLQGYDSAIQKFQTISGHMDADSLLEQCRQKKELCRKDAIYATAQNYIRSDTIHGLECAIDELKKIPAHKDSDVLIQECEEKIEEKKQQLALAAFRAKRKKKLIVTLIGVLCLLVIVAFLLVRFVIPEVQYQNAVSLMDAGEYSAAIEAFGDNWGGCQYKDSTLKIEQCKDAILLNKYSSGKELLEQGKYSEAHAVFAELGEYGDSATQCKEARYREALSYWNRQEYDISNEMFVALGTYKDSKDRIHAHEYTTEITSAPGCETKGEKRLTCKTCPHTYTEAVDATGHVYGEMHVTKAATCTATGIQEAVCLTCQKTVTETIGMIDHSYNDGVITTMPTCEKEGVKTFSCHCGKSYTEAVKPTGHSYNDGVITTMPTCEKEGVKTFSCHCGKSYTEAVKATGHSYNDGVITTMPTCEKDGVKTFSCHCGKSYTEAVKATGHSYNDGVITTAATCEKDGVKTFSCHCGKSYTETVKATGHSYNDGVITTAATCEKDGVKTFSCHCGESYTEAVKATGHNYSEATCTTDSVCANCKHVRQGALGHTNQENRCSRCGLNLTPTFTSVLGSGDKISFSVSEDQDVQVACGKYRITMTILSIDTKWIDNSTLKPQIKVWTDYGYNGMSFSKSYPDVVVGATFTYDVTYDKHDGIWGFEIHPISCTAEVKVEPID